MVDRPAARGACIAHEADANRASFGRAGKREERRIDRREGEDLVAGRGEEPGGECEPRDDAGGADDRGRIDPPAVEGLEMGGEGGGEAGGIGGVAEDAVVHPGLDRLEDLRRRLEVHVGDPHRDHVLGPAVPFLGAGVATIGALGKRRVGGARRGHAERTGEEENWRAGGGFDTLVFDTFVTDRRGRRVSVVGAPRAKQELFPCNQYQSARSFRLTG